MTKRVTTGRRPAGRLRTATPPPIHRLRGDQGQYTWGDRSLWFEERIGPWIAAYRLVPHPEDGRPLIGEVRVFPYEDRRPGPGLWSGDAGAVSAGIDSDVLRRTSTWTRDV
jgi:hypothetical protein